LDLQQRTAGGEMSMTSNEKCAVHGCTLPTSRPNNLCAKHRLPGAVVKVSDSDRYFVITAWAARHGNEEGVILLNDFALGDLFGGHAGFEKQLLDQGFVGVRNIPTEEELRSITSNTRAARWSGPWLSHYPWEPTN
jgi:hypothetical protein